MQCAGTGAVDGQGDAVGLSGVCVLEAKSPSAGAHQALFRPLRGSSNFSTSLGSAEAARVLLL